MGFDRASYVSECESQAKDRGNEQDTQGIKDTVHDGQRNLQEKLDKQHRAAHPGIPSFISNYLSIFIAEVPIFKNCPAREEFIYSSIAPNVVRSIDLIPFGDRSENIMRHYAKRDADICLHL